MATRRPRPAPPAARRKETSDTSGLSDRERAHGEREQLAAIVDSSLDAIIGKDLNGVVTSWNAGAQAIFGYSPAEAVGTPLAALTVPDDRLDEEASILERLGRGERVGHFETVRRHKDGHLIDVAVTISPIRDLAGRVVGASKVARDITALKAREREIERLSGLYAALSQINQAIVWEDTREGLFQKVCDALVAHGGFGLAWIGWPDQNTRRLAPLARAGDESGYLREAFVSFDEGRPEGRGLSATAFRLGRAAVSNDVLGDPVAAPWRATLERCGYRSAAALPIRTAGAVCGTLSVYSSRVDFFHDREMALLEEAAMDLSFALDNFERDAERNRAGQRLRDEKQFSDTMIESMPGVFYFYDDTGRFLRWNRNFETVTGYSGEEIARMHPRDFFAPDVQPLLERRIAEVFTAGESSVEAPFLAKDGTATPYFFTGRRVEFEGRRCLVGVGIDTSRLHRVEQRLVESERKYRELVENANSIILRWNVEGRITFMNDYGLRFFGYTAEEIVGRHVTGTIVPPTDSAGQDLARLIDAVSAAPEAYEQNVNENIRRNGDRVWIAWTNRIVRDAAGRPVEFLSIGSDITERRRSDARLRESEARLSEAQRIAKMGSWVFDMSTRRVWWSEQVYAIFGLPPGAFGGTFEEFLAFVHPDDRVRLLEAQRVALSGGARLDVEHRIVLADGTEKVVHELADIRRDAGGRPIALSGTVHDITDRVRMEIEREKRHQAEAADRIKSAFLATMSHELRTPLNSIIGFTGIVLQGLAGPLTPEQQTQLGMVRKSARHLLALVNDVLDISKIEAGQLEVAALPFEVPRSLASVLALVTPQVEAKGLALETSIDPALGTPIGDERRFEQILLNLLSNAVKFTERGTITLTAEAARAALPGGDAPPVVRVRVADTGIGIRRHDLPRLFQPFRQIDTGVARSHEGTGLGLAICRRLAELMGGTIEVESEWARGSTFTVTLPLHGRSL
jgi:PAS domain S-box-containing protein